MCICLYMINKYYILLKSFINKQIKYKIDKSFLFYYNNTYKKNHGIRAIIINDIIYLFLNNKNQKHFIPVIEIDKYGITYYYKNIKNINKKNIINKAIIYKKFSKEIFNKVIITDEKMFFSYLIINYFF